MARIYIHGKKVNELPHKQSPEGSDQLLVQDEQSNYSTLDELKNYIVDGYATEESVTQEVNTAIANLVGTAPESLDTLQELAEALNNDDDFAATVTNKLGEHDTAISNLQNADTELSNRITALESESTNDYTELENKPQINSITLEGNKTLSDLGIQAAGDYALKSEIPDISKYKTLESIDNAPEWFDKVYYDLDLSDMTEGTISNFDQILEQIDKDEYSYYTIAPDYLQVWYILVNKDSDEETLKIYDVTSGAGSSSDREITYKRDGSYTIYGNDVSIQWLWYDSDPCIRLFFRDNTGYKDLCLYIEGDGTKFLGDDGQYHTIDIPETQNAVMLTLTTDLANGNGTITSEILNKITTARTNKQPIYVINDRPAYPVIELAVSTDGKNEQSQGTVDLIMPTRVDADGKATQVVYQITGSTSTTLNIATVTREVQIDTTGLVQKNEFNAKLDQKQDKLVSGTSIKTINGESILGSGDIKITSGGYYDEEIVSYGVEWDTTVSDPDLTRIGNPLLHKQLPIQSELKGCVAKGNVIQYMLNPTDWNYKQNGEPAILDGTDGDVYVKTIGFYGKSEIDGNKRRVRISTVNVDSTYTYIPPMLISAYRASRDYTNGSDNANVKLRSVVNTSDNFRGGSNNASYDTYLDTDTFRTLLGKPATNISRTNARTQARNNGTELLNYEYYKWILYWLPVIEYATFNIQQSFIEELTADGYHQGGLGNGITTFSYDTWRLYNGINPLVPNGYGNDLGNFTGTRTVNIPSFQADSINDSNMQNWSNLTNCTGTKSTQINITSVTTADSQLSSRSYHYCSGTVVYNITGLTEGQNIVFYTDSTTIATAQNDGEISVNWGNTLETRKIKANFTGICNVTIAMVSSTNGTLTFQEQSLSLARYRGIENIFGDIWTNLDGIIINCSSTLHPDNLDADVYVTTDPLRYADNIDAINNMTYVGTQIGTEGYTKEFVLDGSAEIIPNEIGGSANTYKCDYTQRSTSKDYLRTLFVGGGANSGGVAGLGCFRSADSVSYVRSGVGFRTCVLL